MTLVTVISSGWPFDCKTPSWEFSRNISVFGAVFGVIICFMYMAANTRLTCGPEPDSGNSTSNRFNESAVLDITTQKPCTNIFSGSEAKILDAGSFLWLFMNDCVFSYGVYFFFRHAFQWNNHAESLLLGAGIIIMNWVFGFYWYASGAGLFDVDWEAVGVAMLCIYLFFMLKTVKVVFDNVYLLYF